METQPLLLKSSTHAAHEMLQSYSVHERAGGPAANHVLTRQCLAL